MKNKNNEIIHLGDFNALIIGLFIGMLVIGLAPTQSNVSALMKFNASEFGWCDYSPTKINVLQINCTITKSDSCIIFNMERMNIDRDHAEPLCLQSIIDYRNPTNLFITYFSQFADVSVVVEPERQECVNETVEKIVTCNGVNDCFNKGYPLSLCVKKFCETIIDNITKCQTIPAVTKRINPLAVSENDPATEFCRTKTYRIDDWDCIRWTEPSCIEGDGCGAGCLELNRTIKIKSFTRGEVVEVYGCKEASFLSPASCPVNEDIAGKYNYPKQKVIRCTGDDGTTKDFGDVLK